MKLYELSPALIKYQTQNGSQYQLEVERIGEAEGVRFLCPKCFAENGGPAGTHSIVCWSASRGVPVDAVPGPGRWRITGTGISDLTLSAEAGGSDSVLLVGGCGWHGFVRGGEVAL